MIPLTVQMNIDDEPWRDLDGSSHGFVMRVCGIPSGTGRGRAAVGLAIQLDDGSWVIAETTLRLLHAAVRALGVRYAADLEGDA